MPSITLSYCQAIITTIGAALGLLAAFLWRDLIMGILKRYDIWDTDKGLDTNRNVLILAGIAIIVTLFTAATVVIGNRICNEKAGETPINKRRRTLQ
jgi:hypothetical protein